MTEEEVQENQEIEEKPVEKKVAHNFIIKCVRCAWSRTSSGIKSDLVDLIEVNPNCINCGKWRKFKCAKCGAPSTMRRYRGNSPPKPKTDQPETTPEV